VSSSICLDISETISRTRNRRQCFVSDCELQETLAAVLFLPFSTLSFEIQSLVTSDTISKARSGIAESPFVIVASLAALHARISIVLHR